MCLVLVGHVAGGGEHAEDLPAGVAVHGGVVQNLGERLVPVVVTQGQRVVHGHPVGEDQLVDLLGLLRFGEAVREGGPDELLPGDTGGLDQGLVGVGDQAFGADRDQRVQARLEHRAGGLACLASVTSRAAANTPRTFPVASRYTEALYRTSVSVPSR